MGDERNKSLIYHITSVKNLDNIIKYGIQPRNAIKQEFVDIADQEIIDFRAANGLNDYVPFHFFALTPFQGGIQRDHPEEDFVLLSVLRSHAKSNNYYVIPQHPISCSELIIYDYEEGFKLIDWDLLELRDYNRQDCKNAALAECLKKGTVTLDEIQYIYCKNEAIKALVSNKFPHHLVSVNKHMFKKG